LEKAGAFAPAFFFAYNHCQSLLRFVFSFFTSTLWRENFMHFWLSLILFFLFCSHAFAVPIDLHFTPPARLEIPEVVAGADESTLKKYEVEMAYRITASPLDPSLSHRLGSILYHQGRIDEAVNVWKKSSSEDPNLATAGFMADMEELYALLAAQKSTEAQSKLQYIEKKYSKDPHFQLAQAEMAMRNGNVSAAGKAYRKAVELAPDLYVTHLNLARFLDFKNDPSGATAAFEKALKLAPQNKQCLSTYAIFQFKLDHLEKSLELFRKIYQQDNSEPIAEVQLATLSLKLKDLIGARYWYRAALVKDPVRKDAIRVALSDVQLRLGLYGEAAESISIVLAKEENLPLLVAMGTIQEEQGNFKEAESFYRRALKVEPDDVIANNNLAMLLVQINKASQEALFLAEKAYVKKSDNPMILGTYGCALYRAGKIKDAKEMLSQALKRSPGDVWSRYCYGSILLQEKQMAMAKLHLEGVLILDPDFVYKEEINKILGKR